VFLELFGHAVAEVLGAQHDHLADTMRDQPALGIHPPHLDLRPVELFDPLAERAQDRPRNRRFGFRARSDADGQHARLTGRQLVKRPHGGDVVDAVDNHLDPPV
jgi:hypothetical protein